MTKAVENGLVTESDLVKMRDKEVAELIFHEGFSTNDKADRNSGRGQGMPLIRSLIEENKGTYKIESKGGKSFGMTIKFPILDETITE
jgi:two-component system, chemotaxis family, sensor kinase CheA